jgi:hypothetical protein
MTWHQSHDVVDGVMVHPSDGEEWKHFNSVHPHFSAESRIQPIRVICFSLFLLAGHTDDL